MNYLSSPEQEAAYLEQHSLDGSTGDMSNGTAIANESSVNESSTESLTKPRSSAMSEHSLVKGTPQAIREWLMSLPQDSPVNHSASPESEKALTTKETCGQRQQTLFGLSGLDSFCLKTCPEYASTCPWSSETCGDLVTPFADPSSLVLTTLAASTDEKESGLWRTPNATDGSHGGPNARDSKGGLHLTAQVFWPTPRAGKTTDENEETWMKRYDEGKVSTPPLTLAVKMWPTPASNSGTGGCTGLAGGAGNRLKLYNMLGKKEGKKMGCQSLNPFWVEWLMGWPLGWTDLKPLGMDKFRQWLQQHGRL